MKPDTLNDHADQSAVLDTSECSPLPWHIEPHAALAVTGYKTQFGTASMYPFFIESDQFRVAAILGDGERNRGLSAANAEYIVRACNNHNALKASHDRLLAFARYYLDSEATTCTCDVMAAAAIAQAEALEKGNLIQTPTTK